MSILILNSTKKQTTAILIFAKLVDLLFDNRHQFRQIKAVSLQVFSPCPSKV